MDIEVDEIGNGVGRVFRILADLQLKKTNSKTISLGWD
jgi:hypothetical protein